MTSAEKSVAKLNLRPILMSLREQKTLKARELKLAEELYRAFLFLKVKFPRRAIVPPPLADLVWHEHILHTKKYTADCRKLFGSYLHHTPGRSVSPSAMKRAQDDTIKLIQKYFL